MLPPPVTPKLHPAALSPADVALFPTSPGAAEGSDQMTLKPRAALAIHSMGFPPAPPRSNERARKAWWL